MPEDQDKAWVEGERERTKYMCVDNSQEKWKQRQVNERKSDGKMKKELSYLVRKRTDVAKTTWHSDKNVATHTHPHRAH